MNDRIRVQGLAVDAEIGVHPHEKGVKQRLVIDLSLECDIRQAAASDALAQTVDYDRAAQIARAIATARHHHLIETVAEKIADALLSALAAHVSRVFVRVAKPGAVPDAETVAVEIERSWKR